MRTYVPNERDEKEAAMNRFEAFRDMEDKWRWRLIGGNGRVLVSSNEAFGSQVDALRAAEIVKGGAADAPVSDSAGVGPKEVIARLIRREEARRLKVATEEDRRPAPRRSGGVRRTGIGGSPNRLRAVGARRPA
jgi:uncharacterized protein YegP (UPF0339 family)